MTGTSPEAVRHHYDVGNEFYALWLDQATMSYTAALYEDGGDTDLEHAQERKIDYFATAARAAGAGRILDIGCGWGNSIRRLVAVHGVQNCTGITLSDAQAEWIAQRPDPRIEVHVESWADHRPSATYDAIFAIEAIEHFARPGISRAEKMRAYRSFFESCHSWLRRGGTVAVQVSVYGNSFTGNFDPFLSSQVFPETEPPMLSELVEASERLFELISLRNDRAHYAQTLRAWLSRLNARRNEAIALVGSKVVTRFDRYLRLCICSYESGASDLHRIVFRRIDRPVTANREPVSHER